MITVIKAKNQSDTCTINGKFIHSSYNPEQEANRFVSSLSFDYKPAIICVIGGILPYCVSEFRIKFPDTKVISILPFSESEIDVKHLTLWDMVFFFDKNRSIQAQAQDLFDNFGEEKLSSLFCCSWLATESLFPEETNLITQVIKKAIELSNSVLTTRSFFAHRWFCNSIRFLCKVQNVISLQHTNKPILLIASGTSLKDSIPFITKNRTCFFVLAVSSAILPLVSNNIIPDACISTDGGFYAKSHLDILITLLEKDIAIPLYISLESNIPFALLDKNPIIPLCYEDGLDKYLLQKCKIPYVKALRNGTVSGTALDLAFQITNSKVYACGLDLDSNLGFSHTNPNARERYDSFFDNRLSPTSTRIENQKMQSKALEIYRNWFSSTSKTFNNRFYRITPEAMPYKRSLEGIQDCTWESLTCKKNIDVLDSNNILKKIDILPENSRIAIMKKELEDLPKDPKQEKYYKQLAGYAENLALEKYPQSLEKKNKMIEAEILFLKKIKSLLHRISKSHHA